MDVLNYKYKKDKKEVFPAHPSVSNWLFTEDEKDEATLANAIAIVGEKNGLTPNDLHHVFPAILRIFKSNIEWSK